MIISLRNVHKHFLKEFLLLKYLMRLVVIFKNSQVETYCLPEMRRPGS